LLRHVYHALFSSEQSLSRIRDAILGRRLLKISEEEIGVPGRSIVWKLFLLQDAPLSSPIDSSPSPPTQMLRKLRTEYSDLLLEHMRAPDGGFDESFVIPGVTVPRSTRSNVNLQKNNPLSLDNENPWNQWFAAVELRKTIKQDVERTFPDIDYFRDPDVQQHLTNILFLYAAIHTDIGYRQGMHELLAPLYYAVDYDSMEEQPDDPVSHLCSAKWAAADSWALFSSIMNDVGQWYEWREPPSSRDQSKLEPHVTPVVKTCKNVQETLLKACDPVLYGSVQSSGLEPQIYGLRWLRLLFTREFSMPDAMVLWDGLFTSDRPLSSLIQWVCVAMLIRIRSKLISSDYSTQLMFLLRYPHLPSSMEGSHHITLLLQQAEALKISPSPATAASLTMENQNILSIPVEVPESPGPRPRPRHRGQQASASESHAPGSPSVHVSEQSRQYSLQQLGLPEMIARNFLDRGESLGINKTVLHAVSELKRNLPELANSWSRSPSADLTSYPLSEERPIEQRSSWESRSRFEIEREVTELRSLNRQLGESLRWVAEILSRDSSGDQTEQPTERQEAMATLCYVRDVLCGDVSELDEQRLWGSEEKRAERAGKETRSFTRAKPPSPLTTTAFARSMGGRTRPQTTTTTTHPHRGFQRLPSDPLMNASSAAKSPVSTPLSPPEASSPFLAPDATGHSMSTWSHSRFQSATDASSTNTRSRGSAIGIASQLSAQTTPRSSADNGPPPTKQIVGDAQSPRSRLEVQQDPLGVLR